ncbi:alpha/beta fold hydrolase [Roseobacteraceae bacterium NS-SX3]
MSLMRCITIAAGGFLAFGMAVWLVLTMLAKRDMQTIVERLGEQRQIAETALGPVEFAMKGNGPPVLVVHGAGGGFDQGLLFAEAFVGRGYRWIAPSRFGYLGSPLPPDASVRAQADAFAALLDHHGFERVVIVAVSGGGPPALQFASRQRDRILGLVLISPAPFTPHPAPDGERPVPGWLFDALFHSETVLWTLTKIAPGLLHKAFDARPELLEGASPEEHRLVGSLVEAFLPPARRMEGLANEGAAIHPKETYEVEGIAVPTMIVHARDDRINPLSISVDLSQRITNAELIVAERGGHLLLGHHKDIRRRVRAFLSEIDFVGQLNTDPRP